MPRETNEERREREAREKRSDEVDAKLRAHPNFVEDTDFEDGVTTITFLGRGGRRFEEEAAGKGSAPAEQSATDSDPAHDGEPEDDEAADITFELNRDIICKNWPIPKSDED